MTWVPGGRLPGRGLHRAHQGVRADHDLRGAGHHGQQQQPGLQLAGGVPELADLVAVQRRAGDVGRGPGRPRAPPAPRRAAAAGAGTARARAGGTRSPGHPAGPGPGAVNARSLISSTASGVPSGSCSSSRVASGLMALAGTSKVTGTGQGVPSGSRPLAVTESASAAVMNPCSGGRAPDSSSSRSPSWPSSSVQAGRPDYVRRQPGRCLSGHVHLRLAPRPRAGAPLRGYGRTGSLACA